MDELDLVRLARPEADTPHPDALARMKALAFDAPMATTSAEAPTTDDELVELTPIAPKARHRRRLALVAVAAAVATVGGGLAFATRHSPSGLGTTDTSVTGIVGTSDDALADALDGRWWIERATLQGKEVTFDTSNAPASRTTAVYADAAAGTFGLMTCDSFTAQYVVQDGRLELVPSTSSEGRCADPTAKTAQEDLVRLVTSSPVVQVARDGAVISAREGRIWLRRATASANGVPTMADLFGRHFDIVSLSTDAHRFALDASTIEVADGFTISANVGCNLLSAPAAIEDGVVVIPAMAQTHLLCTDLAAPQENALDALLTSRPAITFTDGSLTIRSGVGELIAQAPLHRGEVARDLDGPWRVRSAAVGNERFDVTDDGGDPRTVTFDVRGGGYSVSMCDTLVGMGFDVPDGRLTLDGSLTGVEAGCTDKTRRHQQDMVVKVLTGRPSVELRADVLTLTAGADRVELVRVADESRPAALADLTGRMFTHVSIVLAGRPLGTAGTLAVVGSEITLTMDCLTTQLSNASITDGTVAIGAILHSRRGDCDMPDTTVDAAITRLFEGPAVASLRGSTLTLTGGGVVLKALGPTDLRAGATPSTRGNG